MAMNQQGVSMAVLNCKIAELKASHKTDKGTVHLEARRQAGTWVARFWGPELQGWNRFNSASEACCYLQRWFSRRFPGHRCTAACRA